jgi:threonine/homoserine/homoserine lactone efflux protein
VFVAIAVVSDLVYAFASGSIGSWLSTRERIARQRDRFTGVVYILLGTLAALSGSGSAKQG